MTKALRKGLTVDYEGIYGGCDGPVEPRPVLEVSAILCGQDDEGNSITLALSVQELEMLLKDARDKVGDMGKAEQRRIEAVLNEVRNP